MQHTTVYLDWQVVHVFRNVSYDVKCLQKPCHAGCRTDGTVVPLGKGGETGVRNPDGFTLNYNEFIVYNTKQIRMRYLLQVKFEFK